MFYIKSSHVHLSSLNRRSSSRLSAHSIPDDTSKRSTIHPDDYQNALYATVDTFKNRASSALYEDTSVLVSYENLDAKHLAEKASLAVGPNDVLY